MADVVFEDGESLVAIVFDVTREERYRISATTTDQEVERSADITDHAKRNLDPITIGVVISDTPLGSTEDLTRCADVWAALEDAANRSLLGTLTTKLRTYEDMLLLEATAVIRAADGTWIKADLTFKPVIQVSSELVDDPVPARLRSQREENLGSQAPTPAPERDISASARMQDWLFGGG